MDPWSKIKPKTDSTFIIALEAQQRGYQLFSYVPENLSLENGTVTAIANKFSLHPHKKKFFTLKKEEKIKLDSFDIVLVRQDPPFNMNYITATYILEQLSKNNSCFE